MSVFTKIEFLILVLIAFGFSKEKKKNPEITTNELKQHVSFLASDSLKGRLTGSEGDSISAG